MCCWSSVLNSVWIHSLALPPPPSLSYSPVFFVSHAWLWICRFFTADVAVFSKQSSPCDPVSWCHRVLVFYSHWVSLGLHPSRFSILLAWARLEKCNLLSFLFLLALNTSFCNSVMSIMFGHTFNLWQGLDLLEELYQCCVDTQGLPSYLLFLGLFKQSLGPYLRLAKHRPSNRKDVEVRNICKDRQLAVVPLLHILTQFCSMLVLTWFYSGTFWW